MGPEANRAFCRVSIVELLLPLKYRLPHGGFRVGVKYRHNRMAKWPYIPSAPRSFPAGRNPLGRERFKPRSLNPAAWRRRFEGTCSRLSPAQGNSSSRSSIPRGTWCGELEADSMLEADYIYLHTLLGSGKPERMKGALRRDPALPECGRQLEPLPGRSGQHLAGRQVLPGLQADGYGRGRSAPREMPSMGPGAWRRRRMQYIRQDLPLLDRPVRLRRRAGHSPGDRAFSELVLLQRLRDLVLVPLDPGAAGDHLRQEALQGDPARAGHRRALCRRPGGRDARPPVGPQPRLVAQFLPRGGPDASPGRRPRASFRCASWPCGARKNGCSIAWRCPTAWGPSIRPC